MGDWEASGRNMENIYMIKLLIKSHKIILMIFLINQIYLIKIIVINGVYYNNLHIIDKSIIIHPYIQILKNNQNIFRKVFKKMFFKKIKIYNININNNNNNNNKRIKIKYLIKLIIIITKVQIYITRNNNYINHH